MEITIYEVIIYNLFVLLTVTMYGLLCYSSGFISGVISKILISKIKFKKDKK